MASGSRSSHTDAITLTREERAALLRCRYASRYDHPKRPTGTPEEYAEEQRAARTAIPPIVWTNLQRRGLITPRIPLRLTAAGEEALNG